MSIKSVSILFIVILTIVLIQPIDALTQAASDPTVEPRSSLIDYINFIPLIVNQTSIPTETPEPPPLPEGTIIIDHNSVELFEHIPDNYVQAVSQRQLLFRHLSVGERISWGLDCLMGTFEPIDSCFEDVPPAEIIYDPKYNRDNWLFEFHTPQYSGWYNRVPGFINRVDDLAPGEFDTVSFKFGYVDGVPGSLIDDLFFNNDPDDAFPSIEDLEAMETRHPDKTMIYWTMGLARSIGTPDSESFNRQMREYAINNTKILLDIADIESHAPDGSPCYDVDGQGIEAMCSQYTNEERGGHPNAYGRLRLAKAVWVMMAKRAGWDGNTAQ